MSYLYFKKIAFLLPLRKLVIHCSWLVLVGFQVACGPSGSQVANIDLDERFIAALYTGNVALVDSCLDAGANINARDVNEVPAFIIAANSGNQEIVKKLLAAGVNINTRSPMYYSSTALMEVAANQDVGMAELLISNGADVHLRDSFGDPAINWASYYGHVSLVDLLVQNGAKWDVASENGSAIDVAMKQWNDSLLAYFIKQGAGATLEGTAKELVQAVRAGSVETISNLLDGGAGASADQVDELNTPVLINAASVGQLDVVDVLLRNGATVDQMNRVGQTAISRAAYFGHKEVVKKLLDYRADVNVTDDKYELSPLISAAAGGDPEIGQMLIDRGADLNHQEGVSGFTPLMMATAYRHVGFVQLLLNAGASPYIKTMEGMTLSDMVGYANNPEIAEMVQRYLLEN